MGRARVRRCTPTSTQVYRNSAFLFFKSHTTIQPDSNPINNWTCKHRCNETHTDKQTDSIIHFPVLLCAGATLYCLVTEISHYLD